MKNILLPTDFSESAWNAIQYAMALFECETCTFHLLNTYTPSIVSSRFMASSAGVGQIQDSVANASKRGLEEVVKRIRSVHMNPRHSFRTISSFSFLVDQIKETIDEERIDLVVTGTKGASGIQEVFMGSNTVRIIKSVKNCPVLAVPLNYTYSELSEIAFATDFTRFYTQSELEPLMDLALTFKATIRIVHVQPEIKALTELQQFNLSMLRKYLKGTEHYVHTISELNSISNTLEIFANELDIHLLAMLNYPHSFMEKMTHEPIIKNIAFHTQIPLLVISELGLGDHSKGKEAKSISQAKAYF